MQKEFQPGDIVKHKLTSEKFLVLSKDGFGATLRPMQRLRKGDLTDIWLDDNELELAK